MGMFDTIRSSYSIYGDMRDTLELQTKDLALILTRYWISPTGYLYEVDYSGTSDMVKVPEAERKRAIVAYRCVPNGNRGRVRFTPHWGYVNVYPGPYNPGDVRVLHFEQGRLRGVRAPSDR